MKRKPNVSGFFFGLSFFWEWQAVGVHLLRRMNVIEEIYIYIYIYIYICTSFVAYQRLVSSCLFIYIYIHLIFLSPMHNFMHRHLKVYIYIYMYMHEIVHWAKEYHILYIYILQCCPVALSNRRMVFASILHTFDHIVWFSKYKIPIQHAVCDWHFEKFSEDAMVNAHWNIPWNRKISVEVLKEHVVCRLQSAWHSFK